MTESTAPEKAVDLYSNDREAEFTDGNHGFLAQ